MKRLSSCSLSSLLFFVGLTSACGGTSEPSEVLAAEIGALDRVHASGDLYLASQPSEDDFKALKGKGIGLVIDLRTEAEDRGFAEADAASELGLGYENPGFRAPEELTEELFDSIRKLLREHEGEGVLLHCGSANRVGAVWLPYRVLDQGVALEDALAEAHEIGLRSEDYEKRALSYIEASR